MRRVACNRHDLKVGQGVPCSCMQFRATVPLQDPILHGTKCRGDGKLKCAYCVRGAAASQHPQATSWACPSMTWYWGPTNSQRAATSPAVDKELAGDGVPGGG